MKGLWQHGGVQPCVSQELSHALLNYGRTRTHRILFTVLLRRHAMRMEQSNLD